MKRLALLLATALMLCGCSNQASRASLPPDKALLGHWKSDSQHYYIGPQKLVIGNFISGNPHAFDYQVVNVSTQSVTLRYPELPKHGDDEFKLADDRRSLIKTIHYLGTVGPPESFAYVDDRQEPPQEP